MQLGQQLTDFSCWANSVEDVKPVSALHCGVRAPKVKSRDLQQAKEKALLQFTYAPISTALLSVFSTFFHYPSHYLVNLLLPSAFTIVLSVFST